MGNFKKKKPALDSYIVSVNITKRYEIRAESEDDAIERLHDGAKIKLIDVDVEWDQPCLLEE